ncbi:MAG: vitamin K-dependent gamma-carboxylase [Flavobacteriaceae bacterium]|jgi:hypothetical protein|uniref:HTTM domain-containing protein n=1 Tax=Candidatus Marifrigoribacter sp. Uisw_064 TaxID=3230970 RepID=UPI003AE133BD
MNTKLLHFLFKPIDASIVATFRIVFGCFMTYQVFTFIKIDFVYQFMTGPEILFPYQELSFLKPLSKSILKVLNLGLLFSAVFIAIGFLYRYAMIFFFVVFTYFTFIDATLYNNHLYLISLIAFVMIFINADNKYSVKSILSKNENLNFIPAWNKYLLIFLISLPYIFGGIAKLSPNWLNTDLPQIIIDSSRGNILNSLFSDRFLDLFITYGGIIYDLLIVFILLNKRTRIIGVILVLIFNLTNNFILFNDIGIFPFFMICSTILFFNTSKVSRFLERLFSKKVNTEELDEFEESVEEVKIEETENPPELKWNVSRRLVSFLLILFMIFHLAMPFRYLLYTDNPEWTGIASRYSWRMKMQSKEITDFKVTMTDKLSGDVMDIDIAPFLTTNQAAHIAEDPYNVIYLAKYLKQKALKKYAKVDPIIHIDLKVKFNGLPTQAMFPPTLELTQINEKNYTDDSWMLPLKMNE